jgi:ribosomal protein S18 acetylase RimI-like enzyme
MGEISMLAVDPDYQGIGIGTALTEFALDRLKDAGMTVAMVETGGDPGHTAARRTYEKAGYTYLPIARYFKNL